MNVTRVLYRCPSCGTLEGLKLVRPFSTNMIECSSCFSTWVIDAGCRLSVADENGTAEGGWVPLPAHYEHISGMPLTPIRSEVRLGLAAGEQIVLISRPRFLFKQERFPEPARVCLREGVPDQPAPDLSNPHRHPARGAPRGHRGPVRGPGDKLHFTFMGKLYRIPFRNESALKWFDSIHRMKDAAREPGIRRERQSS